MVKKKRSMYLTTAQNKNTPGKNQNSNLASGRGKYLIHEKIQLLFLMRLIILH